MTSFSINDLDVHPKIAAAAIKGGYSVPEKILEIPLREIKSKTGLSDNEVERLIMAVVNLICPSSTTGWELFHKDPKLHIALGCENLDIILGGGFLCGALTEIAGESSSGKSQIGLVLSLQAQLIPEKGGISKCIAYLCTETQFPVVRLNQLIACRSDQTTFNKKQFSDNIFVHHLPDADTLLDCIRYQLPHIIRKNNIGAVIVDSVASVFRSGDETQKVKSMMIQQLGYMLRQLASKENIAVIAINQVSASMGRNLYGVIDDCVPSLGLSWANLVTTRIMLKKSAFSVPAKNSTRENEKPTDIRVRVMEIVFCPWLPRKSSPFVITQSGIEDINTSELTFYKE